ncbi:MAG: PEP-CTERM sorting domain-containing protein [Rubripirellula sp.]|nr:PEP-CTERM sorting domain-containing protein [Rubripirellula sp.]
MINLRLPASFMFLISFFMLISGKVHADFSNLIDFENDGPFPGSTLSYSDDSQFDHTDVFTLSNGTTVNFKFIKDIDGVEGTTAAGTATNSKWYIEDTSNKKVASSSGTTFSNDANFAYLSTGATAKPSGSNYAADGVAAGYESQAGDFFLRGQNGFGWTDFVVTYGGTEVTSASGEIWDLDQGVDGVRVTAYDSSYSELAYNLYDISEGDAALDSAPWQWAFNNVGTISYIYVSKLEAFGSEVAGQYANFDGNPATGADTSDINFRMAFNNFNATSAAFFVTPEPSSLLAFGGIFSLAMLRRRRRSEPV